MAPDVLVDVSSPAPIEIRTHTLAVLDRAQKAKQEVGKSRPFIAVLFADLCDSTSYKIDRGDVDGLLKTYMHNTMAGDAVQRYKGKIIKYIGDEVMATFAGDAAIANAARAAMEIQQEISVYISSRQFQYIMHRIVIDPPKRESKAK